MHRIERTAVVPHDASSLYYLVADVESYPSFVPGCTAARAVQVGEGVVDASLQIAKGPFRHWFTTRNTLYPCERITLSLVDGPFRVLRGEWSFTATGEGTRIALTLEFDFTNRVLARLLAPAFADVTDRMVAAFTGRARSQDGG